MPQKRKINERARGKHVGHACEGHLRGLLTHLDAVSPDQIARKLPFASPVEPDAVLISPQNKVRAIVIVAYWENARNSDSKYYRTRTEYLEVLRAAELYPSSFEKDFRVITVLYGAANGWKEKLLSDMNTQCSPMIFLPRIPGCDWQALIESAYQRYLNRWEGGHTDAREHVEREVKLEVLDSNSMLLLSEIEAALKAPRNANQQQLVRISASRIPIAQVSTRYRQPLSILSLFRPEEINAWRASRNLASGTLVQDFALRAYFLDMGSLSVTTSIRRDVIVRFHPRQAIEQDGRYAPRLPDFDKWEHLTSEDLSWILGAHRERTRSPSSVFRGGTFDQCAGNYRQISAALVEGLPRLIESLHDRKLECFSEAMLTAILTQPETWHPAADSARMCPLWSLAVCALATAANLRKIRSDFTSRRVDVPSIPDAIALFRAISPFIIEVEELLTETLGYLQSISTGDLENLAKRERPRLFSISEPCSWLADYYNTLTTNPSHNPLNEVLSQYLTKRFPGVRWFGWPTRRSVSASVVLGDAGGRRQWAMASLDGECLVCGEVKTVTANHWGDKSKEIYDRIGELNRAAHIEEREVLSILLFDGDLGREALEELQTGIAHKEIWTVDEVLEELRRDTHDGLER